MPHISGVIGAGPIFQDIFEYLYSEPTLSPSWYPRPAQITSSRIDPLNGKRISEAESDALLINPRHTRLEIFRTQNLPPLASASDYDHHGRTLLPARYSSWFSSGSHALQSSVAIRNGASLLNANTPFRITSPLANTMVYLDDDLPHGGRVFTLKTSALNSAIVWTCPTLQINANETSACVAILEPGIHQLTATDPTTGYSTSVTVNVESL